MSPSLPYGSRYGPTYFCQELGSVSHDGSGPSGRSSKVSRAPRAASLAKELCTFASTATALAIGLACSAYCRRSSLAVAAAAGLALGGMIGIPAVSGFYAAYSRLSGSASDALLCFLVVVNPFFAEGHFFYAWPRVPAQAADAHVLVQAALSGLAWFLAWRRLRAESEE